MPDGNWYFLQQNAPAGPYTRAAMEGMMQAGTIRPETMVWSGMGDWVPAVTSPLVVTSPPVHPPQFAVGPPPTVTAMPPQGKYDLFVLGEVASHLQPGEQVVMTALLWTGSMFRQLALGAAAGALGMMVVVGSRSTSGPRPIDGSS